MTLHIVPLSDLKEHIESSLCSCSPKLLIENGEMIFIHNAWDLREIIEITNEILNK